MNALRKHFTNIKSVTDSNSDYKIVTLENGQKYKVEFDYFGEVTNFEKI